MGNTIKINLPNKQFYPIYTGEENFYIKKFDETLYSSKIDEIIPLGTNFILSNEFNINDKFVYKDYVRKQFTMKDNIFCNNTDLFYYYTEDSNYKSIDSDFKSVYNNACDSYADFICMNMDNNNKTNDGTLCNKWISLNVYLENKKINDMLNICKDKYKIGNHDCVFLINELRKYASINNNYNALIDDYLIEIKDKVKLSCAFPSKDILDEELRIKEPKECWYKECVFSEKWKLTSSNLKLMEDCNINICDIQIASNDNSIHVESKCYTEYKFREKLRKDKSVIIDKLQEFKNFEFGYILFLLTILGFII